MRQLTEHFALEEMEYSQTAVRNNIDNSAPESVIASLTALCVNVLEPLRTSLAIPIHSDSGYRCPALNTLIGGAPNSQHVKGEADDIVVSGMTAMDLFKKIIDSDIPFDQIIQEGTWVHISYAPILRRSMLVATFVAGKAQYSPYIG